MTVLLFATIRSIKDTAIQRIHETWINIGTFCWMMNFEIMTVGMWAHLANSSPYVYIHLFIY